MFLRGCAVAQQGQTVQICAAPKAPDRRILGALNIDRPAVLFISIREYTRRRAERTQMLTSMACTPTTTASM